MESVRAWPIKLCSSYLTDLDKELADKILTRGFKMLLLANLNTKLKYSAALQEVRESDPTEYESFEEE